jgi:hypothetical protein
LIQQQINRIEQKLAQIEEGTKTSAEKADRAGRAASGKIDRLRTPQGPSQAGKVPPPLLGFRPLHNAKPDM